MPQHHSKLLVSINGGGYYELLRSTNDRVSLSFTAQPEGSDYQMRITDREGNSIEFKCVLIDNNQTTNDATSPCKPATEWY